MFVMLSDTQEAELSQIRSSCRISDAETAKTIACSCSRDIDRIADALLELARRVDDLELAMEKIKKPS
jgi:hypothetical protein